jgi:hypothetical protein
METTSCLPTGLIKNGNRRWKERFCLSGSQPWASIKDFTIIAYRLKRYQISGPDWLGSDKFDLAAKIPDGVNQRNTPEMMQGMLQDRFGLKSHWDKKEASVYTLTLSKRLPAMKETTPPDSETLFPMGNIRGLTSMIDFGGGSRFSFAENALEEIEYGRVHRMALEFHGPACHQQYGTERSLRFSSQSVPARFSDHVDLGCYGWWRCPPQAIPRGDGLSLDSLVNSLKDVGLQLDRGKGSVDILVVDAVQRKPTEN